MKKIKVFLLSILAISFGFSQEKILSLDEVINTVNQNNTIIKINEQNALIAKGDYNQTNGVFLPQISISHTAIATTNPLMAFGSKLNQELLTANDFNPILLNNPSQIQDYATRIEIKQPLINVDGFFQRKAAKARLDATSLQSLRTKDEINLEVKKAYMQLQLAYKTVEVLEKAKEAALENKRLADNSYNQGFLQRADVLAVQVRVTEIDNQLQYAKSNVQNASNYLSVLMNDETFELIKPADELIILSNTNITSDLPDTRHDIQALEEVSEAYKQMYNATKSTFLPNLNAFGTYELHDDTLFQGDANGYLIGAQLSWNIFEGSKRFGKTQKSKAEYEKSKLNFYHYKAQSQVELNRVFRMLQDAKNNLVLTNLALEQSEESLRIRTNRFKEGLEKTSDLLLAETQYAQKQLEYLNTICQHNYALEYLNFLTQN